MDEDYNELFLALLDLGVPEDDAILATLYTQCIELASETGIKFSLAPYLGRKDLLCFLFTWVKAPEGWQYWAKLDYKAQGIPLE